MGLFGRSEASGAAWPLDVLTLEYLISGQVESAAQKWGWSYFSPLQKDVPHELSLTVSGARSTGSLPAPTWNAATAGFAYGTSLVALISRGEATDQIWDKWAGSVGQPVPVEALVGPYTVTG